MVDTLFVCDPKNVKHKQQVLVRCKRFDKRRVNKLVVESSQMSEVVTFDVELTTADFAEVRAFTCVCAYMNLHRGL